MTLDEAGDDEEEKPDEEQAEETPRSAKRKNDDDAGMSYNTKNTCTFRSLCRGGVTIWILN